MYVSGFVSHLSSGLLSAVGEARKKRPFFPEDIVNSDSTFHLCLLSRLTVEDGTSTIVLKNKNSSSTSGTKSYSAVPPEFG